MIRFAALASTALVCSSLAAAGTPPQAAGEPIVMAAHRAVYDLSLSSSEASKGVDSARGRIVYEFTGTACEGYALHFRQVTELSGGEIGTRLSDIRSTTFEDGDGSELRFNTDTRSSDGRVGSPPEVTDGSAQHRNNKVTVRLRKPVATSIDMPGEVLFPTAHMRKLIEAARSGQTTLTAKIFDGSEKAKKPYDTLAVIGKPANIAAQPADETLRKVGWDTMRRWPIAVSYFEEGQADSEPPLYVVSFELLDNGVTRDLKLNYGEFSLRGELKSLEALSAAACDK